MTNPSFCSADLETFSGDTFYFNNCTVEGNVFAYAGYYCINNAAFSGDVRFENQSGMLFVEITGESDFENLTYGVFNVPGAPATALSISDNTAIGKIAICVYDQGGSLTLPCVTLNGGYYGNDPAKLIWGYELVDSADVDHSDLDQYYCVGADGEMIPYSELSAMEKANVSNFYAVVTDMYEDYFSFGGAVEEYADQADWEFPSGFGYNWRIREAVVPSVIAELQADCQAAMGASADSSKVRADLYFTIPDGYDPDDFTVEFNGATTDLGSETVTANGYLFSLTVPAKNMGDRIAYKLKYKGVEILGGTTSVADYAANLAAIYPQYADFTAAMLAYGAAAQTFFGYDTAHLVSDANLAALPAVSGTRFDYNAIQADMHANADIPVYYTAMNVSFLSDTTLHIAFKVKDGVETNAALAWVNANITLGGEAVVGEVQGNSTTGEQFIVISRQNIEIDRISDALDLAIPGAGTYAISVLHYFVSAEERGTDSLKLLTRALYAYSEAAKAIGG